MLSSVHSVAAPSRPRPPGASRKAKTLAPAPSSAAIALPELPKDALAAASASMPTRATTLPSPSRSRLLNVFAPDGGTSGSATGMAGIGTTHWADISQPGTPRMRSKHALALSSPTTDEQFSALINVALANMESRRNQSAGDSANTPASPTPPGGPNTRAALVQLGASEMDADRIGGLSRQELEDLLVAANRKIIERERDVAIAAQIGRTLVEKHDSIKAKHDGILRALAVANRALPGIDDDAEVGPPRYSPPSNDNSNDYFGQHTSTAVAVAASPISAFADTTYDRPSTDSGRSQLSHRRSVGSAAAAYMQQQLEELETRNDDLYVEVEALRKRAEEDKKKGGEQLRGIQRELDALRAELDAAYSRNAELEDIAQREKERKQLHGSEAWKKRVQGLTAEQRRAQEWWADATAQPSPVKIVVQRPPSTRRDSNEPTNDDSADLSWDSVRNAAAESADTASQRLDEDMRLPSSDELAEAAAAAAAADRERVLVAQLLAKIRELEETNRAISERAKEFGDRAGRAFEQGERIKDDYEAVESASRMDLAAELDDGAGLAGEGGEDEGHEGHAGGGGAGDQSFGGGDASFASRRSKGGDSPIIRRRAPGNRYAIEGRRTVRSAIRREKAAMAELLAQGQAEEGDITAHAMHASTTAGGPNTMGASHIQTVPASFSLSSMSSFNSSLGSLKASSSESSFQHSRVSTGSASSGQGQGQGYHHRTLKPRRSALMLGRPKIRITPSCEDMAAARAEEARQKLGGWEDLPSSGAGAGLGNAEWTEEMRDDIHPLGLGKAGLPASSRSLRRIASDGLLGNGSDSDGSPFTSRRRTTRTQQRRRSRAAPVLDAISPSSSFNSIVYPGVGAGGGGLPSRGLTLGSELGSEYGGGDDSPPRSEHQLAVRHDTSGRVPSLASTTTNSPLKYRRPRRTQSSMTLGVSVAEDDEDALSDIAELRFPGPGSTTPDRSMELSLASIAPPQEASLTPSPSRVADDISQSHDVAILSPLDKHLHLHCSPASDGVWAGDEPVLPRGALRDGEMTQYAAYDLLERAADLHPVAWADDEDFGRPITEGEARRLKLLEDGRDQRGGSALVGGGRARGLLAWLQPAPPKKSKRGAGAATTGQASSSAPPRAAVAEIESAEQIEARRQLGDLLRQKRLAALQRAAAAKRGGGYDLSSGSLAVMGRSPRLGGPAGRAGLDDHDHDDDADEEEEIEARALAFSPSRQRRFKRLSMHGLPPGASSGEELLMLPGSAVVRKRRSRSKMREGHNLEEAYDGGHQQGHVLRRQLSISAYSDVSSDSGGGAGPSRQHGAHNGEEEEEDDEEEEERFELVDVPVSVRRARGRGAAAAAGADYYPVDLYARYRPSMVQSRVKVASSEVVTLISTWALFATVTVFAFVVAFSRGPRRVLGTPSGRIGSSRRTA